MAKRIAPKRPIDFVDEIENPEPHLNEYHVLPKYIQDFLLYLSATKRIDAAMLYQHYHYIKVEEKRKIIHCPYSRIRELTGWNERKVIKAREILVNVGLIELLRVKKHNLKKESRVRLTPVGDLTTVYNILAVMQIEGFDTIYEKSIQQIIDITEEDDSFVPDTKRRITNKISPSPDTVETCSVGQNRLPQEKANDSKASADTVETCSAVTNPLRGSFTSVRAEAPAQDIINIKIPLKDDTEYILSQEFYHILCNDFSTINVLSELRRMISWSFKQSVSKRKTRRGIPQFIRNWLTRAEADQPKRKHTPVQPKPTKKYTPHDFFDTKVRRDWFEEIIEELDHKNENYPDIVDGIKSIETFFISIPKTNRNHGGFYKGAWSMLEDYVDWLIHKVKFDQPSYKLISSRHDMFRRFVEERIKWRTGEVMTVEDGYFKER